jgi:putative ABC transport system permease protein
VFLGAAGLLLALTVMNAATLLLARGLDRRQELDVRVALGAGRLRVAWLLLSEAIVLSIIGGAVGVLLAYGGVEAFVRFAPSSIPRVATVSLDGDVLVVAVGATILAGFGSGLLPTLTLARRSVWDGLQVGSRVVSEPASLLRTVLVGGQLALAVVLLCGAGLLFSSFLRLRVADVGFDPDGLVMMSPSLTRPLQAPTLAEHQMLWDGMLSALAAAPGVTSAAGASGLPFEAPNWTPRILLPEDPPEAEREGIAGYAITPGFLRTMGIDVLRGRGLGLEDGSDAERVALVNEAFVRTQLEGRDALGMILTRDVVRLSNFGERERTPLRVVGIVEDVVQSRAEDGPRPAIYIPYKQADALQIIPWRAVVRSALPPSSILTSELRQSFDQWDVRPDGIMPIGDRIALTQITPRFRTMLLGSFAGVALLVAALGLYGSLAHMVRRRQRDLGVRMALGADRASILRMVMGQGMRLSAACMLIGLGATLALGRVLDSFLFATEPYDPRTLMAAAGVLLFVCAVACLIPARKATAMDPLRVLQSE